MNSKQLIKAAFMFSLLGFTFLTFQGCSDPVTGCTDQDAENYNPDAEENDAAVCVYARDKFIGSYNGTLICPGGLGPFINNPVYPFSIEESLTAKNAVAINLNVFGSPAKLAGTVDGGTLTIDQTIPNVPFDIPGMGAAQVNIKATGTATITGNNLTGNVAINITTVQGNLPVAADNCPITGVKAP